MAGRHSRWVEAERKKKKKGSATQVLQPRWTPLVHSEKIQPVRKPCCFFFLFYPVSKKKKKPSPGLRLTDFTCFLVSLYPG